MPAKHDPSTDRARRKYKAEKRQRFTLEAAPEEIESFKTACLAQGTTATTEIRRFMAEYTKGDQQ